MNIENDLIQVRDHIDQLDLQIQDLINKRAACAKEIARIKGSTDTVDEQSDYYRAEREAQVLRNVLQRNRGPLNNEEMARLFREIMSACLALEQKMQIAFLGPEGTFTQAAALKHFGHSVETVSLGTIDEVFREVESGSVHFGVVPVENSTEGVINHTLDLFMNSYLKICGEVELRIHHHLLVNDKKKHNIQYIYSHRQSFAQCREWLDTHMPGIEKIDVSSNAEAARRAKIEDHSAAIAGETAAKIYELEILKRNIEDKTDNTTRFLIIGRDSVNRSGHDKTSLFFSAPNKPGALYTLLEIFARNGISMTGIESRPSRQGMWDYVFFIDIEGHVQDTTVSMALEELRKQAAMLKILGSYPKAVL